LKKIYQITAALLAVFLIFLNPIGAKADESQYFLISNESVNGTSSQNAGSFQINNESNQNTYKLDYVRPFNVEKNRQNILQDRRLSIMRTVEEVGDNKYFSVADLREGHDGEYSSIKATLKYSGVHANVWVADSNITSDKAAELGREFDNKIYGIDVTNFGNESDVDGNHKVNILCYDIQDDFLNSGGYIAGYFDPRDLFDVPNSNYSEIFYIDTNPLMGTGTEKDVSQAYSTLAHEFQHMINFNQNVLVQGGYPMDVWIDEGLSMAAEQIYSGYALGDRIDYYNNDTAIANGLSFLNWDNNTDVLANYSLAYLFMQYLRIQSGQGNQIYKQLINDSNTGYLAVQDLIHKYINPNLSFSKFMNYFREALYFNKISGRFGFQNEPGFGPIQQKIFTGTSLSLDGGGSVVTTISSSSIPTNKGSDITYTNLTDTKFQDNTAPVNPSVNVVDDNDTALTGATESNAVLTVTVNGKQLGLNAASSSGSYKVAIPKQKAGTTLNVYATDEAGNKSQAKLIAVKMVHLLLLHQ
jgi:hypothetical protein